MVGFSCFSNWSSLTCRSSIRTSFRCTRCSNRLTLACRIYNHISDVIWQAHVYIIQRNILKWCYTIHQVFFQMQFYVERGSSAVKCRTRNRGSPGSNPPLLLFRSLAIFVLSTMPRSLRCINEYLVIDSGGNVID